ncbi:hypothetical protein GF402_00305 [Candidatus Fermentibacteria bacterium]|nr:hypothetical protein [Candidatus Fermentibacteria bacterium]
MIKAGTVWVCLALIGGLLLFTACGPSQEQLRARDEARSAALAAEQRLANLQEEYEELQDSIPELQARIEELEAELAELQAEYEALGGGR